MRGATARLVGVGALVLCALALAALAASSDRAPTLRPVPGPTASVVIVIDEEAPVRPDEGETAPARDSRTEMPVGLLWFVLALLIAPVLTAAIFLARVLELPRPRWRRRPAAPRSGPPPEVPDEVAAGTLATAVEQGLRELDQGGAGEGVVASWVLLERAAADAGTHRAAPDTPSELAGKLIDRHAVSSAPLLRLADLYREARFSRHELPEAARAEAREILERLRAELAASPVGGRR